MVKARPVVVISPSLKGRDGLVTVVPLSSTPPTQVQNFHFQLPRNCLPQLGAFQQKDSWVQGDMVYTVAMDRLDLYRLNKRGPGGKRLYFTRRLGRANMAEVYRCVLNGLGLSELARHLVDADKEKPPSGG